MTGAAKTVCHCWQDRPCIGKLLLLWELPKGEGKHRQLSYQATWKFVRVILAAVEPAGLVTNGGRDFAAIILVGAVARAPAQAMSQWLARLTELRASLKTQRVPVGLAQGEIIGGDI